MRLECSARSMKAQRRRAHKNIYPGSPALYLRLDLVVSAAALIVALDSHQEESLSVTLVLILFAEAAITYCTGAVRVAPSLVFHHQSAPIFQHGDKVRIETIFVGLETKGCILLTLQVAHPARRHNQSPRRRFGARLASRNSGTSSCSHRCKTSWWDNSLGHTRRNSCRTFQGQRMAQRVIPDKRSDRQSHVTL